MIRIDEIYYNVFVKALQHRPDIICHWFDPFGSTDFNHMCVMPSTTWPDKISTRLIFWDQEPFYKDVAEKFVDEFQNLYHHESATRIIITSEKNNPDLQHICDTYGFKQQYYFFHGWAALDWYRGYDHSFLSKPVSERKIRYPLFIPNNIIGGKRQHRVQLLAEMARHGIVDINKISFPDVCPYEQTSAYEIAKTIGKDIDHIKLPLIIDKNHNHANDSHKIDFWDQAQECFCHVVTETVWGDRLHLTEKIFKPIVMQQPFILVGSRFGLAYLRQYGFKTFSSLWDESYDNLEDAERMLAITELCAEISGWSVGRLQDATLQIQDILDHNFKWFYGGFQNVLWKEINDMLDGWR